MHAEKISEIKAHFIGLFDAETEAARLRLKLQEGRGPAETDPRLDHESGISQGARSPHELGDFDPGVKYVTDPFSVNGNLHGAAHVAAHHGFHGLPHGLYGPPHLHVPHMGFAGSLADPKLPLHEGPGGTIAFLTQATVLHDDDRLDMTGGHGADRDLLPVFRIMAEMSEAAHAAAPFSDIERTDSAEGLTALADRLHAFRIAAEAEAPPPAETDDTPPPAGDPDAPPPAFHPDECDREPYQTSEVGDHIEGLHINGKLYDAAPVLADLMPDRGIAEPVETEVEGTEGPLTATGPGGDSVTVAAGANVLVNSVGIVDAGMFATACAVVGDYHEIDVISQVTYVASSACLTTEGGVSMPMLDERPTLALNIAGFERDAYAYTPPENRTEDGSLTFPDSWRVSVVAGDLTFVNWIEQYQLISDNDTMVITRSGTETSIITGGNVSFDTADFFGVGIRYDLVIVGGNVYDMNVISQIAVLYDRDSFHVGSDESSTAFASGGNLLWNQANIQSYGLDDRFETAPQGISDAITAIETRDPDMPDSLSTDPHFAGYTGLNVLYITGDLFQANVIKQVAVLGDADDVHTVASHLQSGSDGATITIDTGANALINVASIVDYDSFGTTTFIGGGVYSDAILIQAGLVDQDGDDDGLHTGSGTALVSEVVAFLDTGSGEDGCDDDHGHSDFTWADGHLPDVMQTVTG